jgi:signal transduction histidine kinase
MARVARASSKVRKRTVVYAIGAAVLVLLLVAGLAFANSISVTRVTNNARSLHWANAAMGTSALTRAGLVQAVTFAELQGSGVVGPDDLDFAEDQLSAVMGELEDLVDLGAAHESYPDLARFLSAATVAARAIESGDVEAAKEQVRTDVERNYIVLVDSLGAEQTAMEAAMEENTDAGRTLNAWVVFILTLAVPGSAVIAYFLIARRQMRAMRERNRIEVEAERTINRAKDAFIAGLSHELRTPLTSIYGFAEILTDGGVQGPEATAETAQIIANEAAEMTRMVDDLLAASRLDSTGVEIEMERTNVRDVVEAAVTPFARAGMEVVWEPTNAFVDTDAARLKHVLINLLSNAARHGGPECGIEVTEGDGVVDIEVWDNGAGVPEDQVDRLFDRFVHAGDAPLLTGSVGLGLAIASRLTALMDGSLRYQRFGAKTYFVVTVPASAARELDEEDRISVASMIRALSS